MKFPNKETVEKLRKEYPVGTRVELVSMDDFQAPPLGTKGTVKSIDDTGSLLVNWDNGSGLKVFKGYFPLPPLLESQKQRLFLLGITEKYRKQDMSSFVISSQCNNCMAYQAKYKRKTATAK